jgi:tetrahydrodipicolinate N-succinyltransferase
LGESHINDKSADVIIEEDVWVGTRVTILAGVTLGRGSIIAANAVVTKPVPPYALMVGMPARIIGVKFSLSDIERHEEALYPANERLSHEELVSLFNKYYNDKKVFGCSDPLTEEQQSLVNKLKKKRGMSI